MIGALFYLVWTSWKNRCKIRLRRLKQPKYLLMAIVGGLYIFYVMGFRFLVVGGAPRTTITPENAWFYESVGALILSAFVVLLGWVLPSERAALIFSEAELAF